MEKVRYIRVSHETQNTERQEQGGYVRTFIDKCSGLIPFNERPASKELIKYLKQNTSSIVSVKSVDRLGRNTIDILQTIEDFNQKGYIIEIEDLGMNSQSPFFPLMVSLLSTLSEHERNMIRERSLQGIKIRKEKGL